MIGVIGLLVLIALRAHLADRWHGPGCGQRRDGHQHPAKALEKVCRAARLWHESVFVSMVSVVPG